MRGVTILFLLVLFTGTLPAEEVYVKMGDTVMWWVVIRGDCYTAIESHFDRSLWEITGNLRIEGELLRFEAADPSGARGRVCGKSFVKRVQDGHEYLIEISEIPKFESVAAEEDPSLREFMLSDFFFVRTDIIPQIE